MAELKRRDNKNSNVEAGERSGTVTIVSHGQCYANMLLQLRSLKLFCSSRENHN